MCSSYYFAAAAVALVAFVAYAYYKCKFGLNSLLPATWQRTCAQDGFVGAFGRSTGMQHCLASCGQDEHDPPFNRCSYM